MKCLFYFILAIITVSYSHLHSQDYEYYNCPEVQINRNVQEAQLGGRFKPSLTGWNQYFRVLFVFAQFSGDNRSFPDWTYGQLPTYAYNLVDSVVADTYRSFTLSDYWKKMALGSYDLIGDVYPNVVTLRSEDWYRSNDKYFQDANKDVLDSLNGKIDFKKYDNWGYNTITNSFYFSPRNADNYLDMMYIIYRTPVNTDNWFCNPYDPFGGVAILGFNFTYTTHDTIIIDGNWLGHTASGITIRTGAGVHFPSYIGLLAHELGHYFFGAIHTDIGGLMCNNPTSTFALNGWERERLGHTAYTVAYQDSFTITLQDFVETGQVLKIPVPGTNDKYFLVENHQRLSKYDQIMRGGQLQGAFDTTTTLGKGIYVWLIRNANNYQPNIDVRTANGSWNWTYVGDYYAGLGWYVDEPWEGYLPLTQRASVNRNSGKSDRHPSHIYWNGHWASKWVDTNPVTGQYEITRNVMGLETHPFNLNYTNLFTPWSSPSTYVDAVTNTSMQIFNENGNNITLKIFNTYASSINLPPSKPQNLGIAWSNNHPKLTWETSIEPDMQSYKIWKYAAGSAMIAATVTHNPVNPTHTWTDYNVDRPKKFAPGIEYIYKVKAVDSTNKESVYSDQVSINGIGDLWKDVEDEPIETALVDEYKLFSNYPNPFNPSTVISYSIKEAGLVKLKVYDILGREVVTLVNEKKEAGYYSVEFNASNLPSGVYIYRMQSGDFVSLKKMLLIK